MWDEWNDAAAATATMAFLGVSVRILIILAVAWFATGVIARTVERVRIHWMQALGSIAKRRRPQAASGAGSMDDEWLKRSHTIANLSKYVLNNLVFVIAGLMAAGQAGFEITAVIGAAGIVSLAVGFGARSLVQDVLSGATLLLENQIREGDVVRIGETAGLVEQMTFRHLRLRSGDGVVHVISNGSIGMVSNLTYRFSCYVWDLKLSYHVDIDHAVEVLHSIGKELRSHPSCGGAILDDLEILGVDAFTPHAVILKMRIKTLPRQQFAVGRAMNRMIKLRFDELGIPFPVPTRRFYLGEHEPVTPDGRSAQRERLKQEVKAILEEMPAEISDFVPPPIPSR